MRLAWDVYWLSIGCFIKKKSSVGMVFWLGYFCLESNFISINIPINEIITPVFDQYLSAHVERK